MSAPVVLYVAGFLFSPDLSEVVLVRKSRPTWQAGLLNGVGGKVEAGESPRAAMQREFEEETGLRIESWERFASLQGDGFEVLFFRAESSEFRDVRSMTDEEIVISPLAPLGIPGSGGTLPTISNLRWLIPMAMPTSRHDWPYRIVEHG